MLDQVRYFLAVLALISVPPAVLYWFAVHPFSATWRRLGSAVTLVVLTAGYLAVAALLFVFRDRLIGPDYGFRWALAVPGALAYALAALIELQTRRQLKLRVLVGVPELNEDAPSALLTEGIYARSRNPRYVSFLFGMAAMALFCNYLSMWVLLAAMPPALWLIVVLEERELRQRFGADYEAYCRSTPRWWRLSTAS